MDKIRKDVWMPVGLYKKIEEYQKKNGISTMTATILELIRKGLDKN